MKRIAALIALLSGMLMPAYAFAASGQTMCYDLYKPVCAAQQVECFAAPCYPVYHTYSNDCVAGTENATIIHEGECTAAETGPVKPATTTVPYQPPAGCIAWNDGCNSCGMSGSGGAVCTQMACVGPTKPGYCTAYQTPPSHDSTNPGSSTSSPVVSASTTASTAIDATTTAAVHVGFFSRMWHALASLFSF